MNKQKVFDEVATHLLKQNARAIRSMPFGCAYRGEKGRKCGIGKLIPDKLYHPSLENRSASAIFTQESPLKHYFQSRFGKIEGEDREFLDSLQELHDSVEVDLWEEGLIDFAHTWGLELHF